MYEKCCLVASLIYIITGLAVRQTVAQSGSYSSLGTGNCICTSEYKPVCGSNGRTYNNFCTFKCEQTYTPGLYQLTESACGAGAVYGPFSGSGTNPTTFSFGTPNNGLYGGQPSYPGGPSVYPGINNPQSCAWTCPNPTGPQPFYGSSTYPGSQYNPNYGYNVPNTPGYPTGVDAGLYAALTNAVTNASPYGNLAATPYGMGMYGNPNSVSQVCDSRGGVHAGECQYYRAVCENDKRGGGFMTKAPCLNAGGGFYGNSPFRTSLRSADEPSANKPKRSNKTR